MLEQICQMAREAGDAIMRVYDGEAPLDVAHKSDDSPVTAADIAAHKVIVAGLAALTRRSVVCAEITVTTRHSNGFVKSSSAFASG